MDKIKDIRRRLAALPVSRVKTDSPTPATSLAECRAIQSRLRELKREVLARISGLRTEVSDQARESVRSRTSMRGDWKRRKEAAKQVLSDVQKQVIGLVDGKHGDAIEAWTQISEEIDERLDKLEQIETRLVRLAADATPTVPDIPKPPTAIPDIPKPPTAVPDVPELPVTDEPAAADDLYATVGAASRPPEIEKQPDDTGNDDLYAAVGATVRQGGRADAYCPHCGKGIETDDRFCRRCGHRLLEES